MRILCEDDEENSKNMQLLNEWMKMQLMNDQVE